MGITTSAPTDTVLYDVRDSVAVPSPTRRVRSHADPYSAMRPRRLNDVSDDVIGLAMAWARDVADNCAPTAVAVIKGQLLLADVQDLSQAVDSSLAEMRAAFARDDLAEAVMAKIAKRPPAFAPRSAP